MVFLLDVLPSIDKSIFLHLWWEVVLMWSEQLIFLAARSGSLYHSCWTNFGFSVLQVWGVLRHLVVWCSDQWRIPLQLCCSSSWRFSLFTVFRLWGLPGGRMQSLHLDTMNQLSVNTTHGQCHSPVLPVLLSGNDIVDQMPIVGVKVHPSCLVISRKVEYCIYDYKVMRSTFWGVVGYYCYTCQHHVFQCSSYSGIEVFGN